MSPKKKNKHLRGKGKPDENRPGESTEIAEAVEAAESGELASGSTGPEPAEPLPAEASSDSEAGPAPSEEAAPETAPAEKPANEPSTEISASPDSPAEDAQQQFLPLVAVKSVVEAILLVSPEPVDPAALAKVYPEFPKGDVEKALAELEAEYAAEGRGLRIKMVAEGYRLETRPEFDPWLDRFFEVEHEAKLSLAALETLAIVAYRQPMTLPEINDIRGVNSAGVLRTLLERKLVKIHGRKPVVGSPFMYRTTKQFLEHFGLASLADLPKPEEMEQLLGEGVKLPGEIGQLSLPEDLPEGEEGSDVESTGEAVAVEETPAGEEHPEPAAEEPASPPAESSEETADPSAGEEGAGD